MCLGVRRLPCSSNTIEKIKRTRLLRCCASRNKYWHANLNTGGKEQAAGRRELLLGGAASAWILLANGPACAAVELVSDDPGFGQHAVSQGDLVLVHYTGTLADSGEVFDTTLGGLKYRDGGRGVLRPLAFRLQSGNPQPGICTGLQEALVGMKIGGKRTVIVPPEQGFGSSVVLAPYAVVPANSTLKYELELLRVSSRGPDEMFKGISGCSQGGASATAGGCANITAAEYF